MASTGLIPPVLSQSHRDNDCPESLWITPQQSIEVQQLAILSLLQ